MFKKYLNREVLGIILGISAFLFFFLLSEYDVRNLKKHPKMVVGHTTKNFYGSKSRPYIKYKYVVDEKEYLSKRSIKKESVITTSNQPILVIYDSTNISISTAILDVDISSYNENQLDSLFKVKVKSLNIWNFN
jgi:hypothetical protein